MEMVWSLKALVTWVYHNIHPFEDGVCPNGMHLLAGLLLPLLTSHNTAISRCFLGSAAYSARH